MAQQYPSLSDKLIEFIGQQKVFFVGTAGATGSVNISPKGMDSFRVINPNKVAWLNVTGSGNESATHVLENGRMTIMFMSVSGPPMILRLYGEARVIHEYDEDWSDYFGLFEPLPGARQVFVSDLSLVQTSCGFAVPEYEYVGDRETLKDWATKQGEDGIRNYWQKKNMTSLDGHATQILGHKK